MVLTRAAMPYLKGTSSSSSSEGLLHDDLGLSAAQIVHDADYPAASFPGYAEKPLSEQLEPIAVVGMGNYNTIISKQNQRLTP